MEEVKLRLWASAEAWYRALGLAAIAGPYAFLQNVEEDKTGKGFLKPVDGRVWDAVRGRPDGSTPPRPALRTRWVNDHGAHLLSCEICCEIFSDYASRAGEIGLRNQRPSRRRFALVRLRSLPDNFVLCLTIWCRMQNRGGELAKSGEIRPRIGRETKCHVGSRATTTPTTAADHLCCLTLLRCERFDAEPGDVIQINLLSR